MTRPETLDVEAILRTLAELRKSIPLLPPSGHVRDAAEGRTQLPEGFRVVTAEDFDYAAVAEGLQSLLEDIEAVIDQSYAGITQKALEVYWEAEELARDPAHADLIPHVQRMREAYERDHGRPIPARVKR